MTKRDVEMTTDTKWLNEQYKIKMKELCYEEQKRRKAPGIDEINMELCKYENKMSKVRLLQLFNKIWNEVKVGYQANDKQQK